MCVCVCVCVCECVCECVCGLIGPKRWEVKPMKGKQTSKQTKKPEQIYIYTVFSFVPFSGSPIKRQATTGAD